MEMMTVEGVYDYLMYVGKKRFLLVILTLLFIMKFGFFGGK